jgi:hypothetical protein
MKLQIDVDKKVIKIEESVNLGKLAEVLYKFFPNNEWKEYELETHTTINNWSNPIIIREYRDYYPWWSTVGTYNSGNFQVYNNGNGNDFNTLTGSNGVYNVQV